METKKKEFVLISAGEEKLHIPTNSDGNIDVSLLKEYFPNAIGLTYKFENEKRVIERIENYFKPPFEDGWGSHLYSVFVGDSTQSCNNNEDRIQTLMAAIREQKRRICIETTSTKLSKNRKKTGESKETNKKSQPKRMRLIKLYVGWLHKGGGHRYTQVKKPIGGTRIIEVQDGDIISVSTLVILIKNVFFQNNACYPLGLTEENTVFSLGNYDGTVISEFQNNEGQVCNIWEYLKCRGLHPSRHHFYLLTHLKSDNQTNWTVNEETQQFFSEFDKFEVQFYRIKTSSYTNCTSFTTFCDERACIECITSEQPNIIWDPDKNNVLDFNFEICSITLQDLCFLNISYCNELEIFEHSFPTIKGTIIPHSILYNTDELIGVYGTKLGICVIPSCTRECKPIFKWYRNDYVYREGFMMYFINISHNGQYWCDIQCTETSMTSTRISIELFNEEVANPQNIQNCENLSINPKDSGIFSEEEIKTVTNTVDSTSSENKIEKLMSIPIISKDDLLFSKTILGYGAQGMVTRGVWLGTDVAIKTIRTGRRNMERNLAIKEIDIHCRVRHPNIVQIMGYSYESNCIHIVMELVNGDSLDSILFSDDIKAKYNLNENQRTNIATQICQAVNYLHRQSNPIIHRDLKPSNILISNPGLNAKICDLGVSKLNNLTSTMRTVGVKGTPLYMAPELLIEEQPASIKCDVWSLGCTLIELYSEEDVWELENDNETILKQKMINLQIPSLKNVPLRFRDIISRCLSYSPEMRPDVDVVLNILREFE